MNQIPSKSRQKYLDYIGLDSMMTFAEFLGIDVPRLEYKGDSVRLTSSRATGEYCLLLKDAKASYKDNLKKQKS